MFSLDKFYNILHSNLIAPLHHTGISMYFYPFGTYDNRFYLHNHFNSDDSNMMYLNLTAERAGIHCYFFDQEPLYNYTLDIAENSTIFPLNPGFVKPRNINIFANSEHSALKKNFIKQSGMSDWYYFYHGFAALDWFRDCQYINFQRNNRFNKVFSCYNHLISKYRAYRLHLVSDLINRDIMHYGSVSLPLTEGELSWRDIIEDPKTPLDNRARKEIYVALQNATENFVADTTTVNGTYSASINVDHLTASLFHVVTETVYFHEKLHLTEKIFKPIATRRPFILAGAVGNLAYLKSYGFKTFDRWIDESYDQEPDNYLRIKLIVNELEKLCKLGSTDLTAMYNEMQSVLEYNHQHLYTRFKENIVNELVDNFGGVLSQFNNGRQPNNHSRHHWRLEYADGHLEHVRQLLKS